MAGRKEALQTEPSIDEARSGSSGAEGGQHTTQPRARTRRGAGLLGRARILGMR